MVCSRCGFNNTNNDKYCTNCGNKLLNEETNKNVITVTTNNQTVKEIPITPKVLRIIKIIMIIIVLFTSGPFIIASLAISGVSIYSGISQQQKIAKYEKTEGKYISEGTCESDGLCTGIYKYEVDGIEYKVESNTLTDELAKTADIYYNPSNHKDALVKDTTWILSSIIGLIPLIFVVPEVLIMVFIYKMIKKGYEKNMQQGSQSITI